MDMNYGLGSKGRDKETSSFMAAYIVVLRYDKLAQLAIIPIQSLNVRA